MTVHIDRTEELADIARRISARLPESPVGFVCGPRRIGKSALLLEARTRHRERRRPIGYLDLEITREPEQVLQRLVDRLEHVKFRNYRRVDKTIQPVNRTLTFGDVTMSDQSEMTILINGADQQARNTRCLTRQFIQDLQRARSRRPFLLLDNFDRCPSDSVRNWLREDLLPGLAQHADVLVLVAAESVPWGSKAPANWLAATDPFVLNLEPFGIDDVLDWMSVLGLVRSRVLADFLIRIRKGVPGPIAEDLDMYLVEGGTGQA